MQMVYPQTDNVIMNVRALDCDEAGRYFSPVGAWGTSAKFSEQCMNVKNGEKPEVRIGN